MANAAALMSGIEVRRRKYAVEVLKLGHSRSRSGRDSATSVSPLTPEVGTAPLTLVQQLTGVDAKRFPHRGHAWSEEVVRNAVSSFDQDIRTVEHLTPMFTVHEERVVVGTPAQPTHVHTHTYQHSCTSELHRRVGVY